MSFIKAKVGPHNAGDSEKKLPCNISMNKEI